MSKKEHPSQKKTEERAHKEEKGNEPGKAKAGAARTGGSENPSQYGWYNDLLHDRFFSQWDQPTSLFDPQHQFTCTLEIQISKNGSILGYKIVRGSGNEILDQSVLEAAAHVKQIDALPSGLGKNGIYTVRIDFELGN